MSIVKMIDHTMLAADATIAQIDKLCQEAKEYGFASVCVNSCHVAHCASLLADCDVKVCTVVGFPLGAMSSKAKAAETRIAVEDGADEIDMVINIGALKDGRYDVVADDIKAVREACKGKTLKVIIETCLLTDDEKRKVCEISCDCGADFVKTSTGFSKGGAKAEDVALMESVVSSRGLLVKASGGIRNLASAREMVAAGASRLGCSAGVVIAAEEKSDAQN